MTTAATASAMKTISLNPRASISSGLLEGKQLFLREQEIRPGFMDILVVLPQPDGIDRTGLLAEAAEDAAQGVDFVPAGIAGAVLALP